jgi:hypothetical protein
VSKQAWWGHERGTGGALYDCRGDGAALDGYADRLMAISRATEKL